MDFLCLYWAFYYFRHAKKQPVRHIQTPLVFVQNNMIQFVAAMAKLMATHVWRNVWVWISNTGVSVNNPLDLSYTAEANFLSFQKPSLLYNKLGFFILNLFLVVSNHLI